MSRHLTTAMVNLTQRRLRNQLIDGSQFTDPADVVRALCAVQAQDYYGSLWAIGLRTRGAVVSDIEQAINDRRIVRTWPMRGTLHLVAAEDVHWLRGLLAPRMLKRHAARILREYTIDHALLARAGRIVEQALRGGQAATRTSLYERLEREKIKTEGQRGLHILWWLANEGVICCGRRSGKQHTFVLLDEWIPETSAFRRDEALARLAHRYFAHHGPATLADFVWWSGLTIADAMKSLDAADPTLVAETTGKTTWWSGPRQRSSARSSCHLLPVYDEYAVGYADRSGCLDPAHANHAAAGHGIFRAPIVIDGRIVGSWTRELRKDRVEVRVTALTRFDRGQLDAMEDAAECYGKFLGLPAVIVSRPRRRTRLK